MIEEKAEIDGLIQENRNPQKVDFLGRFVLINP